MFFCNCSARYLSQTLASLVTRLSTHKDSVYIHVFNADSQPHLHTEALGMSDLFPGSTVRAQLPALSGAALNLTEVSRRKLLEGVGFVNILNEMQAWKCPNYVLLEDDALAEQGWSSSVLAAAQQLRARKAWLVTRLYTVRKYVPLFMPWGISDFDQGFNTVALLLNAQFLAPMAEQVRAAIDRVISTGSAKHFPAKDNFMVDRLTLLFKAPILSFEPPVFQHVGVFSSLESRNKEQMEYYM